MLADEGTEVIIDDDKAMQVLTLMQSLSKNGLVPERPTTRARSRCSPAARRGFFFQGEWEITTFQTAKMPFSMTLFPNVFGGSRYAVQADSHTLVHPQAADRRPRRGRRAR